MAYEKVIKKLAASTENADKSLKNFGITAYDAAGNMKSLNQIFSEINNKLSDMERERKYLNGHR